MDRLSHLLASSAIAIIIYVWRPGTVSLPMLGGLTGTIFGIMSILLKYSPDTLNGFHKGLGFSLGHQMIGGSCECDNPWSWDNMRKSVKSTVFGPKPPSSKKITKEQTRTPIYKQVKTIEDIPERQDPKSKLSLGESLKDKESKSLCQKLIEAGFDPRWRHSDVQQINKTRQGRRRLKSIVKTVGRSLTLREVSTCFPGYYNKYVCVETPTVCSC
jgi:hypothetical protein